MYDWCTRIWIPDPWSPGNLSVYLYSDGVQEEDVAEAFTLWNSVFPRGPSNSKIIAHALTLEFINSDSSFGVLPLVRFKGEAWGRAFLEHNDKRKEKEESKNKEEEYKGE